MKNRNRISLVLAVVVVGSVACSVDEPSAQPGKPAKTLAATPPPSTTIDPKNREKSEPAPKPKKAALTSTAPSRQPSLFDHALAPEHVLPERVTRKAEEVPESSTSREDAGMRAVAPGDVKITRLVLATDVSDREPLGESQVFPADTPKIFAFLELDNQDTPYQVNVHFESLDEPKLPYGIALDVKTSPRWRTWAYTRVRREPGMYRAVVRTVDGQDIASQEFEITEAK